MFASNKWNLDASVQCPDRNEAIAEAQDAVVIGLRRIFAECRSCLAINLEGIRDFGDRSDSWLRAKAKAIFQIGIGHLVQIELAERLGLEAFGGEPRACGVAGFKRLFERLRLFAGRSELDCRNELHAFLYRMFVVQEQERRAFLPAVNDGVSSARYR